MDANKLIYSLLSSPFGPDKNCINGTPWINETFSVCVDSPKHLVGFIFYVISMLCCLIWLFPQICYNYKTKSCFGVSFFWILFYTIGDALSLTGKIMRQHWAMKVYESIVCIPPVILLGQFINYRIIAAIRNRHEPLIGQEPNPVQVRQSIPINMILLGMIGLPYFMSQSGQSYEPKYDGTRRLLYDLKEDVPASEIPDYIIAGLMAFFYTTSKIFQVSVNVKYKQQIQEGTGLAISILYICCFGDLVREIAIFLTYDTAVASGFVQIWYSVWFFHNLVGLVLDLLLIVQCHYYRWQKRTEERQQQGVRRAFRVFFEELD